MSIYNPDSQDFVFYQESKSYTLRALESTTLPKYLADHAAGKLADKLVWKRGVKTNYEDDKKVILEEIYG